MDSPYSVNGPIELKPGDGMDPSKEANAEVDEITTYRVAP